MDDVSLDMDIEADLSAWISLIVSYRNIYVLYMLIFHFLFSINYQFQYVSNNRTTYVKILYFISYPILSVKILNLVRQ